MNKVMKKLGRDLGLDVPSQSGAFLKRSMISSSEIELG